MNKTELNSYLGQFIDLKTGKLKEVVIKSNNKAIETFLTLLRDKLEEIDEMEKMDAYQSQMEELENQKARCPKCGDEVLGEENALCYRCV